MSLFSKPTLSRIGLKSAVKLALSDIQAHSFIKIIILFFTLRALQSSS